jgi:hypothetical protein
MDMYIHFNPYLIDINVLRIMGTVVIMKLNKRVSNITNGLRFDGINLNMLFLKQELPR